MAGDEEKGSTALAEPLEGELFASSQFYFPILITRHYLDSGDAKQDYTKVGIPYRLDGDQQEGAAAGLSNAAQYELVERPVRVPIRETPCTQYYHGHCFNSLLKLICLSDRGTVAMLLKAHDDLSRETLTVSCTCGRFHRSDSITAATDCFGANALHIAVRMVGVSVKREEALGICSLLLDYGADPNSLPLNGVGTLDAAVEARDLELIKMLVARGAHITSALERTTQLSTRSTEQHDTFEMDKIDLLLGREVLLSAPDPLISSFYVCVILDKIKADSHAYREQVKALKERTEQTCYEYIDNCRSVDEARTLVEKEVLMSADGPRVSLMEYAVYCHQKTFCSHQYIQHIIDLKWNGLSQTGSGRKMSWLMMVFWAVAINVIYPSVLFHRHVRKKAIDKYTWRDSVAIMIRTPCFSFIIDILNHILYAIMLIYSSTTTSYNFAAAEVLVFLTSLSRLLIEYDNISQQGLKRYLRFFSNVLNLFMSSIFAISAISWALYTSKDTNFRAWVVMVTRYLYALAAAISVSKIATMLEVDRTFGPMTKIIKEMTKDFCTFILMMILVIVAFGIPLNAMTVQSFVFSKRINESTHTEAQLEKENFGTVAHTWTYLVYTIFGYGAAYAGSVTWDEKFGNFVINAVYVGYLIMLVILLLNLLIAILNTTYSVVIEQATKEWNFTRVTQLTKYTGLQPFMFPFNLYLYPLNKVVLRVFGEEHADDMPKEDEKRETARRNYHLHNLMKKRLAAVKT